MSNNAPGLPETEAEPRNQSKICLLMPKNHRNWFGAESIHGVSAVFLLAAVDSEPV
jgi:hypothetical protein